MPVNYNTNFYTSFLELSKNAVETNIRFIRNLIGKDTILSAVVKGNAYGHGIEQFVPVLEAAGVRHFSVFSSREAWRVLDTIRHDSQIMIMGWIEDDHLQWAITHDISFYVFEMDRLDAAIAAARFVGKKARIHIELETGMNRTGFEDEKIGDVTDKIKANRDHLILEGLCTHYAGAESISNFIRIKSQIEKYNELYQRFKDAELTPLMKHTACSAAMLSYPETHMDMVRIGILLYGFWPSKEIYIYHQKDKIDQKFTDPLKRVISWKTQVMSTKKVSVGEFIGYGTSYQAPKNMAIATVPVGYSYGFTRNLSNLGRVLVKGKRAAVIGVVNMNLMIINITDIKDVKKGDEVILIGTQNKRSLTVASFGELSNQLNYELLSRLPTGLPRIVV